MRSIASSSAARNSAPSPGRRPSYQSRVSNASASASGRKLTRRVTRDPSTSDELHPRGLRTQAAERAPSNADPAPQPPRASTRTRPHVRPQRGFPTEPSRAQRVRPPEVSGAQRAKETSVILCQYSAGGVHRLAAGCIASPCPNRISSKSGLIPTALALRQWNTSWPTPASRFYAVVTGMVGGTRWRRPAHGASPARRGAVRMTLPSPPDRSTLELPSLSAWTQSWHSASPSATQDRSRHIHRPVGVVGWTCASGGFSSHPRP